MVDSIAQQKASLRRLFRQRRNALSMQQQADAAAQITTQFFSQFNPPPASRIAVFISNDGEIDLSLLCRHCWENNYPTYLPIVDPELAGHLRFMPYHPATPMALNRYGIAEPDLALIDENDKQALSVSSLDYLLMPLVAFDAHGNRLGMGGGYYDRTLAGQRRPNLIGVAHDCQQTSSLPVEPWDIPLSAILTPTQLIRSNRL